MKQWKALTLVVVLLVIAAVLIARQTVLNPDRGNKPVDIQAKIREIENNPHMPPQAKAIAIGQLRAHSSQGLPGETNR